MEANRDDVPVLRGHAPEAVSKPVFGSARHLALPASAEQIPKGGRANLPGEPGFEMTPPA